MQVVEVSGTAEVATLLRQLASEIERGAVDLEGRSLGLSRSLKAVVELTDGTSGDVSLVDVRLLHPAPDAWDLKQLQQALAHPGD